MSFPHWDLAFPDQEKRFPRVHFAFPHREMSFPRWDFAFPDQEKRFPRVHFAFPHREMSFPRWDLAFPDQEKRFPRVHFAFPHREMAFPTARERDYGNQKVSLLVAFLLDELDVHIRITDAGCASAGTMSTVASRTTLTISSMSRNVLLNLYPNFYPPLGRLRWQICNWSMKHAEKRNSNLHALTGTRT